MSTEISQRLAGLDEAWKETSMQDERPADGTYNAVVQVCKPIEAKNTGNLFLLTELRVIEPEAHRGKVAQTWHRLDDPNNLKPAKRHLHILGVDIENLSQLQQALVGVLDSVVEITVKTNHGSEDSEGNPYVNTYVNRRLQQAGTPASDISNDFPATNQTTQGDTDDIPF